MASRDYFQGKRIAVVGLGPHGEMIADAKHLIKAGALVSVYDLRSEARLKSYLLFLRSIGLANYVCGSIPADDLLDMDLVILSHAYPRESSFLRGVYEKKIPVEYPETLFFKLAPPITLIGVMGSCGKATVTSLLEPMLEIVCDEHEGQGFFVIDHESSNGALAHLKKIRNGDIVLMRIEGSQMLELHDMRVSPHIAVFTTVPPKGSYVASPFEILTYQTYNNFIIGSDEVIDATHNLKFSTKAKMLRTKAGIIPSEWEFNGKGAHDYDNAALALQAARLFKVSDDVAMEVFRAWKPLKGRLEFVKKVKNVEFYNDSASISPVSTLIAAKTLSENKNIILLFGGADGKKDYRQLYAALPELVNTIILLPGSGTMRERLTVLHDERLRVKSAYSIEEATRLALECAQKGDRVLFSPGFEVAGLDSSRRERGERFVKAVRAL